MKPRWINLGNYKVVGSVNTENPIALLLARPPTQEEKWSEVASGGCSI